MPSQIDTNIPKTNQHWAWEFLRRNPSYQSAFKLIKNLNQAQKTEFAQLEVGIYLDEEEIIHLREADIHYLDTTRLLPLNGKIRTIGDYLDSHRNRHKAINEDFVNLPIPKNLKRETYFINTWIDPNFDLDNGVASDIWEFNNIYSLGVIRSDNLDHVNFSFDEPEYKGWPPRSEQATPKPKSDKRTRKNPAKSFSLPLVKGTDNRVFTLNPTSSIELSNSQACMIFDVALPLDFQIENAKYLLKLHQADLLKSGFIREVRKRGNNSEHLQEYLTIIDLVNKDKSISEIALCLGELEIEAQWKIDEKQGGLKKVKNFTRKSKPGTPVNELTQNTRKKIERALYLRDYGYSGLAFTK